MYSIIISPRAKRELKKIKKIYRKGIAEVISELSEDPYSGKPLERELTKRYTYKIGVYRIIYKINEPDKKVFVSSVGHRSIVYS